MRLYSSVRVVVFDSTRDKHVECGHLACWAGSARLCSATLHLQLKLAGSDLQVKLAGSNLQVKLAGQTCRSNSAASSQWQLPASLLQGRLKLQGVTYNTKPRQKICRKPVLLWTTLNDFIGLYHQTWFFRSDFSCSSDFCRRVHQARGE